MIHIYLPFLCTEFMTSFRRIIYLSDYIRVKGITKHTTTKPQVIPPNHATAKKSNAPTDFIYLSICLENMHDKDFPVYTNLNVVTSLIYRLSCSFRFLFVIPLLVYCLMFYETKWKIWTDIKHPLEYRDINNTCCPINLHGH